MTSPYATKDTRCFDTSFPTLIFPETRPRRIGAASLMRHSFSKRGGQAQVRDDAAGEADKGTVDIWPGGYEHPWSHTTTSLRTYQTETIQTCREFGIESCNCCSFVGTVARSKHKASKARRNTFRKAFVGVGPEGNGHDHIKCKSDCKHTVTGYPPISKPSI